MTTNPGITIDLRIHLDPDHLEAISYRTFGDVSAPATEDEAKEWLYDELATALDSAVADLIDYRER